MAKGKVFGELKQFLEENGPAVQIPEYIKVYVHEGKYYIAKRDATERDATELYKHALALSKATGLTFIHVSTYSGMNGAVTEIHPNLTEEEVIKMAEYTNGCLPVIP